MVHFLHFQLVVVSRGPKILNGKSRTTHFTRVRLHALLRVACAQELQRCQAEPIASMATEGVTGRQCTQSRNAAQTDGSLPLQEETGTAYDFLR